MGCVARGGVPDDDAPLDPESMRYWATVDVEKDDYDSQTLRSSVQGAVRPEDAMQVIQQGVKIPTASQPVADPAQLVNQHMASAMSQLSIPDPASVTTPAPKRVLVTETCMTVLRNLCFCWGLLDQVLVSRPSQKLPPRMQLDHFLQ